MQIVNNLSRNPVYVAGVPEAPQGKVAGHSELAMVAVAAREALAEAGMTLSDVDGIFVNYMGEQGSVQVCEYLGIQPRYADTTNLGGAAFEAHVHHALTAIATCRCEVALVAYASRQRSKRNRSRVLPLDDDNIITQFEAPYAISVPIGHYALLAARHMHQYGTSPEQLAEVAVAARSWAQLNPKAWSRDPLTVQEVLTSPMMSDPLHLLDCCLVTDGGGALVLTRQARARDAAKKAIRVLRAGESHTHWHIGQMPDMTKTAAGLSGREAFGMAGIQPKDIDVLEPYDSFTITVILQLEDLGFCEKGEGGAFVEGGRLGPGGDFPALTSAGGLSYNHPGALGLLLLVAAVRQLRGEAGDRQVPGARLAAANGVGGLFSTASTVILANE